ncbi:MAG: putative RiPP precursor [Mastigocladus sp. ERB_26_2]
MKKTYSTPMLIAHGSVEDITQAFGNKQLTDFLFFNGSNIPDTDGTDDGGTPAQGSIDGIIHPVHK